VSSLLIKIFGSSLLIVKIVPLLAGIVCSILIGLIVYQLTRNKSVGILSALILPTTQILKLLAPIARVDTLGIMFSLLGIYIFLRYETSRRMFWCLPFLILSIFTKQSLVAAPLAICLYLFINRGIRTSLVFGFGFVLLVGITLAIGSIITEGQLVTHVLVNSGSQISKIDLGLCKIGIVGLLQMHFPIILAAVVFIITSGRKLNLVSTYFIISVLIFILTVGKPGASWHYGLEVISVGSILTGLLLAKGLDLLSRKVSYKYVFLGAVPVMCILLASLGFPLLSGYQHSGYTPNTARDYQIIETYIKDTKTKVFTEEPIFPMQAGVAWEPWEPATILIADLPNRGWDQSILVSRFQTGYYEYVLTTVNLKESFGSSPTYWQDFLGKCRFTKEMAEAITGNYSLVFQSNSLNGLPDGVYIYKYGNWTGGYPVKYKYQWSGTLTFGQGTCVQQINPNGYSIWSTDLNSSIERIDLLSNKNYLVQTSLATIELSSNGSVVPVGNRSLLGQKIPDIVYSTRSGQLEKLVIAQRLRTGQLLIQDGCNLSILNGYGQTDWSVHIGTVIDPVILFD
jgi:hypothetical protein